MSSALAQNAPDPVDVSNSPTQLDHTTCLYITGFEIVNFIRILPNLEKVLKLKQFLTISNNFSFFKIWVIFDAAYTKLKLKLYELF